MSDYEPSDDPSDESEDRLDETYWTELVQLADENKVIEFFTRYAIYLRTWEDPPSRSHGALYKMCVLAAAQLAGIQAIDALDAEAVAQAELKDLTEPEIKEYLTRVARLIESLLPPGPSPRGKSLFCLLIFDEDKIGHYLSNAERADIIKNLREFADGLESGEDIPH